MKRIQPPKATSYDLMSRLKKDPQVVKWVKRLLGDPEALPTDLDEDRYALVVQEVLKQRGEDFAPTPFKEAMIETRPIISAPDWTDDVEDLTHIFEQPEMKKFWREWKGPKKAKGPSPDYAGAKTALTAFAMSNNGTHIEPFLQRFARDQQVIDVFAAVEGRPITLPPYSTLCRHIEKLGPSCTMAAIETNIEIAKAMRALYPKKKVGKRLLIDCSSVAGWCRQHGTNSPEREAEVTARTPHAKFRRYTYAKKQGKSKVADGTQITTGAGKLPKEWRGYYLGVIVDQATGLPLVWMLFSAGIDEATAIVPLLSLLHRLWPDIDAESITGDCAWDEKEWHRLCEVDYGIAPIFRQKPTEAAKHDLPLEAKESQNGSVRAITREGQLICETHRKKLPYATFERPSRAGLNPGQSSDERLFRVRAECKHSTKENPHPCGKIGLRAMVSWHRLTRIPHHAGGSPRMNMTRVVMLARLNGVEQLFNRLKGGKLIATDGADRTRVLEMESVEAIISLACLSMTALSLACERLHLGVKPQAPAAPTFGGVPIPPAPVTTSPRRSSVRTAVPRRTPKPQPVGVPGGIDFDDIQRVGLRF